MVCLNLWLLSGFAQPVKYVLFPFKELDLWSFSQELHHRGTRSASSDLHFYAIDASRTETAIFVFATAQRPAALATNAVPMDSTISILVDIQADLHQSP